MRLRRSSRAALATVAFAFAACPPEKTRTGNLQGQLSDAWVLAARNDWRHLAGAFVVLDGGPRETVTDEHGGFLFTDVPVGDHEVSATAAEYLPAYATATVAEGTTVRRDLALWPSRGRWLFDTGAADIGYASPALSGDEATVYVGTGKGWMEAVLDANALVAVDTATGVERWRVELGTEEVRSSPAVAQDGSIYFVAERRGVSDVLRKIAPDGTPLWSRTITTAPYWEISSSTPALGADGTVYVCGDGLFAFTPGGDLRWRLSPAALSGGTQPPDLRCAPAVAPDGTVYASAFAALAAVTPDGAIVWSNPTAGTGGYAWLFPPSLGADGTIYVGDDVGVLHAIRPGDGSRRWSFDTGADLAGQKIRCAPAVAADGTVYFGTKHGGRVYAVAPNGTRRWSFEQPDVGLGADVYTSPAIGGDGTIYAASEAGFVYALAPDGTLRWRFQTEGGIGASSPAIASDGTLYVGNMRGHLCALNVGAPGLQPGSPWPRFRRTNQNTGRAGP